MFYGPKSHEKQIDPEHLIHAHNSLGFDGVERFMETRAGIFEHTAGKENFVTTQPLKIAHG
jgi:hypothetical protein